MRNENNARFVDAFNGYLNELAPKGEKNLTDIDDIAYTLNILAKKQYSCNAHWDKFAHMEISGVATHQNGLKMHLGRPYLVNGNKLEIYNFSKQPDFGFMRLSFDAWERTGLYDNIDNNFDELMHEDYVNIGGKALNRDIWEDPHENLPPMARLESRLIKPGAMIIVSKGSVFNGSPMQDYMESLKQKGKLARIFQELVPHI